MENNIANKVKERPKKTNFYFSILNELKSSTNLKRLQNKLKISKQQLNYYLRELKKKGFVYNKGYGWWELTKKGKNPTGYGVFLKKDTIRGHAYVWNINLRKKPENWEKRIEILKNKNINYKLVGIGTTPRIKALGRKVWLCNDHLRIYDTEKASYYGETAEESKKNALNQLYRIIQVLENKLGFYLQFSDIHFKKEHYALIKNDLAIDQNRKGIIMRIRDKEGEWLLIDDSLEQGGELETIGKKAFKVNLELQKWWNDNKKHNFQVTPTFIMESINHVTQNQVIFDNNMKSHLEVLKKLGDAVEELTIKVGELNKLQKKLK